MSICLYPIQVANAVSMYNDDHFMLWLHDLEYNNYLMLRWQLFLGDICYVVTSILNSETANMVISHYNEQLSH